jgi:excisionase family DNA binding protein
VTPSDRIVAIASGKLCAKYAERLEELVRNEQRRNCQTMPDDLGQLLHELVSAGVAWRAAASLERTSALASAARVDTDPTCTMLTTKAAGKRLGVTDRGIRDLLARGRLVGVRADHGRGSWLIPESDVDRYGDELKRSA